MSSIPTAIRTVKSPTLPTRPVEDDDMAFSPTAEDEACLHDLFEDDDTPVPDWVDDEPEPFDEEENAIALDANARWHNERFHAAHPECRSVPYDRLSAYLIRPDLADWLARTGGHEII